MNILVRTPLLRGMHVQIIREPRDLSNLRMSVASVAIKVPSWLDLDQVDQVLAYAKEAKGMPLLSMLSTMRGVR